MCLDYMIGLMVKINFSDLNVIVMDLLMFEMVNVKTDEVLCGREGFRTTRVEKAS